MRRDIKLVYKVLQKIKWLRADHSLASRGHTLIELLVSMLLLGVFITLITQIFTTILGTRLETETYSSVSQDGRFVLARIAYDIRSASAITTPANPGNTSSSLVLQKDVQTYTYSLSGGNIILSDGVTSDRLNGSGSRISALEFRRLGSGPRPTIRTTITLEGSSNMLGGTTESRTFSITTGLR